MAINVEAELAKSRAAQAQGDLEGALYHVGCALTVDPMRPDLMAHLNEVLTPVMASADPLSVAPATGDVDFVTAATRAYILAWMGRWVEALDLVTDVAEIRPDVPYLRWAEWWIGQPGVLQQIKWEDMYGGILTDLAKIAMRCPVPLAADDPRLPNVQAAGRLIDLIRGAYPREAFVWITGSLVNRRLGNAELGLAMAQQAYHLEPSWKTAVGVANALKEQRQVDEAASWYRKALSHDPDDLSALIDLSDLFLDAERWADVIKVCDQVLAKEDNGWAAANRYYAYYRQSGGDPGHRLALMRLTEGSDVERAKQLVERIAPSVPYVTDLPDPGDASNNGLEHVFQGMWKNPAAHHGSTLKLDLSHVEAPSVLAAFHLQMEMWGPQVAIDYKVRKVQTPDPRAPKAQVPWVLWQWDGVVPRPAVDKPDFQLTVKLNRLASEPFALDLWIPAAQALARELGVGAVPGLLAALVHPPRPTGGQWRVLPWVQRSQIATALVLAHIDGGWAGSQRQQILFALLYGPTDWTTVAAIVALAALTHSEPDLTVRAQIRRDVEQAFAWMRGQVPTEGFCCFAYPLGCAWLTLDGLSEAQRADVAAWTKKLYDEVGASTVYVCELEAKKFDQAEEMAKAQGAQQAIAAGGGGDPDPVVFPGQPVAKLSDYVKLMKMMQTGNMMGALAHYKLDMMQYASVATAWGGKLGADPTLNAKFAAAMAR